MFKDKYLKVKELEGQIQILKAENDEYIRKSFEVGRKIIEQGQEISRIKLELSEALKKINVNVWIDTVEGPVLITHVRGKMGTDMVFFNSGKTEEEAERLLMLSKLES